MSTQEKRAQLRIQLAEHTGELIEAVIDGVAAAGSLAEWDSETVESVISPIQNLFERIGIPIVGEPGERDENTKFWCEVGGYDYEGEYQDDEDDEPTTYEIHSKYVDMEDAIVSRGKYHGGGLAVVAEAVVDGFNERETLSVNLEAYGMAAAPNEFWVKDYGPHEGLADALVKAGIATKVHPSPRTFGPHDTQAWLMLINGEIR